MRLKFYSRHSSRYTLYLKCNEILQNTSWFFNLLLIFPRSHFCFSCRSYCFYLYNLVLVVKFGVYNMAKTRGTRDIDESQQKAIIEGRKQGWMHKKLVQQFGISKSALTRLLKRWKIQGGYIKKKKTGRLRCTFSVVDCNILRKSRSNPRLMVPDIVKDILSFGESNPSVRTIRHRL